jgi:hypothetical protein
MCWCMYHAAQLEPAEGSLTRSNPDINPTVNFDKAASLLRLSSASMSSQRTVSAEIQDEGARWRDSKGGRACGFSHMLLPLLSSVEVSYGSSALDDDGVVH